MKISLKDGFRFPICNSIAVLSCIIFATSLWTNALSYKKVQIPEELSVAEKIKINHILEENYKTRRSDIISPLPYNTIPLNLPVSTNSVMLIDTATGNILYEKNADTQIPPASMTKLVEMYVVFEALEKGEVSLDDIVPLPKECWSINLPRDASLMFLAEGQKVTLDELLLGLSIASGNDASIAVANYVAGSMDAFVERMNAAIESLGLKSTHFVESSGYSEFNLTTARDFAAFTRVYVNRFPWALERYHSQKVISYPLEKNLPDYQKYQGDSQAITQYNTNKLLGNLPGCDGLKTGFINESGYNITVTAQRNGQRFLCVMMRGPGSNTREGNKYRVADGTTLMETAFSTFATYEGTNETKSTVIPVLAGKNKSVRIVQAYSENFTVPKLAERTPQETVKKLTQETVIPKWIKGDIKAGDEIGYIFIKYGDTVLNTIPLVAEKDVPPKGIVSKTFSIFTEKVLDSLSNN